MKTIPMDGRRDALVEALIALPLFRTLSRESAGQVADNATLVQFDGDEDIVRDGDESDSFYVLLRGAAAVLAQGADGGAREVAALGPRQGVGEMGLILNRPRTATVRAKEPTLAARFDVRVFQRLFDRVEGFGLEVCRALAERLEQTTQRSASGGAGADSAGGAGTAGGAPQRLDALLRRAALENASVLHLAAGLRPRWRVGGELQEVAGEPRLGRDEVFRLLAPIMDESATATWHTTNDVDFACEIDGLARFRVNLYRDVRGASAVLRVIPARVSSLEELGLPPLLRGFAELPKGLVLVSGPSGSGKSATLAALIDLVNRTRSAHVVTIEDPVEFVHESRRALITQREVGTHTQSFAQALRAALREDPDIVLVGEMRDVETISLALEVANTGHLVFGTLHTSSAIGTVDRIVSRFPVEQQPSQRALLADVLRGVVSQALCRKIGGGRVPAVEVLVVNDAVRNLIREGKGHQVANVMSTGQQQGNRLLNDSLAALVRQGQVGVDEALRHAVDPLDLRKRLGEVSGRA